MSLKVLTYNIHKGFNWSNQKFQLDTIKKIIIDSGADIVFLQEVVGKNDQFKSRGHIDAQFEFLADEIWSHFSYAKNAIYDHGHHGNLILSKYPLIAYDNINISTNKWEQRGMLTCQIQVGKNLIHAICVHLNLLHSGRRVQYQKILHHLESIIGKEKTPIILAGDFNDWNQKASHFFEYNLKMLETHRHVTGNFAKTFPSIYPLLSLDRIYVKNLKIISSRKIENGISKSASDHIPLYCELELQHE